MEWLSAIDWSAVGEFAQKYGYPAAVLTFFAAAVWAVIRWTGSVVRWCGTELIKPLFDRGLDRAVRFVDSIEALFMRQSAAVDKIENAIGRIEERQQEHMKICGHDLPLPAKG